MLQSSRNTLTPGSFAQAGRFCVAEVPAASGWKWAQRVRRPDSPPTDFFDVAGEFVRDERMARVEAVLLISASAVSTRRLAQLATLADTAEARAIIEKLNFAYDQSGSAFRIERVAAGYRMLTRSELVFWLDRLHQREARCRLSQSALETLTIIAYQQPITRADLEAIRGVASTEMLKQLLERGLVRIAGHDDSLGRPYLYGTTRLFLEMYGMQSLDNLPMAGELRRKKTTPEPSTGTESPNVDQPDESDDEDPEGVEEDPVDEAA